VPGISFSHSFVSSPMSTDRHAARRRRLVSRLKREHVEALLVTGETNVTYLTGFSGDSSYLLLGSSVSVLISDTRYTVQITEECPGLDVTIRDARQPMPQAVARIIGKARLTRLAVEGDATSVSDWNRLAEQVKPLELSPLSGLVEELRMIKDASEVASIREAIEQAERGFDALVSLMVPEMTELEVAHQLEHLMRRFGAWRASFEPIVATGPRAALPHARPGDRPLSSAGFVLIDWGASNRRGYKSDLTRVIVTGKVSSKLEKVYGVVFNAQRRGLEAIRPGVSMRSVDAAARRVIEQAGYGKNFGHGLGHGIGLDIHEEPRLSPIASGVLKPGMVLTVEPGIYLPGWGGVRIEDDVLVTRDGCEVLSSVPKRFEDAVLN